jgi:crotonobetainyl-CoA:carnitine CoA-transferase CaiB-like acyl-CoA transferase
MSSLPLSRYTVLDLTIARAGPTAVRLLADWGASVIKIEPPPRAEAGSVTGARHGPDEQNLHRNKRGLALDLKDPDGHRIFLDLVARDLPNREVPRLRVGEEQHPVGIQPATQGNTVS